MQKSHDRCKPSLTAKCIAGPDLEVLGVVHERAKRRLRDRRMVIRDLLEDAQNERFRADVISGALTGLTQSMVFSPKAREARIAEVKGEIAALNAEIATKECVKRIG